MDAVLLVLRVVLSLGAVVAVLWLVQRRLTRTSRSGAGAEPLVIISRRGLGQKASVVLVDTGGKRFLLGVTEQCVNVLHTDDAPVPETVADTSAENFARILADTDNYQLGPRRRNRSRTGALHGSILSASTWRQAGALMRRGLTR